MKYPTLGIIAIFLRSLAETLERENSDGAHTPVNPVHPPNCDSTLVANMDDVCAICGNTRGNHMRTHCPSSLQSDAVALATTFSLVAPATGKPPRTRRTKEQIAADKAAEEAARETAEDAHLEAHKEAEEKVEEDEPAAPIEGAMTYEELQALIQPFIKAKEGQQPRGLEVKAIIRKYTPDHEGGLKQLATLPQHHKAFAADIEALSY